MIMEILRDKIVKLSVDEQCQIFDIFKKYNIKYTETKNNVLISSSNVTEVCIAEIQTLVSFFEEQNKKLNQRF